MMDWKKAAATATAAVTIAANIFSIPVFATTPEWGSNGGQQKVEGGTYVVEPEIEVELPGDLGFGLNPMKLNVAEEGQTADKSQIVSGTYVVTNRSNVPVAVSAKTKVTAGADVVMIDKTLAATDWDADTSELKPKAAGKKTVLLAQLYPTAITVGSDGEPALTVGTIPDKAIASKVPGDILTTSDPETTVYFVMDAYSEANANKSMGGFKFGGALDPNANFTEDDIKVDTVFEMNILTEEQKANATVYPTYKTNGQNTTTFASTVRGKKTS